MFRVLSGIIAAFLLLVALPSTLSQEFMAPWESILWAGVSLYAGIGMALGALTGRWFGSRA